MNHGNPGEKIVRTVCNSHCGGTCEMKVHVRDGRIVRIEPVEGDDKPKLCARGHAYRQRVYAPDRLLYPLKRTGARGSGEFSRISWDEALETIAAQMKLVKAAYGNASILHFCSMCDPHVIHHVGAFHRLLCLFGGYTAPWGYISCEGAAFSAGVTYGSRMRGLYTGREPQEFLDTRLIIMWSWNPGTTELGTLLPLTLARAKEQGARIVCVDPRFTDSAAVFAEQWVPIRPGTDVAAMTAMSFVIFKENLQDQKFIDDWTVGFHDFRDYLFGRKDGVAKSPEWAAAITGIRPETLTALAREYAGTRGAVLATGFGAGRTAMGEQYHRAAAALEAITGNVDVRHWLPKPRVARYHPFIPSPPNQVEAEAPPRLNALPFRGSSVNSSARVNVSLFADAILKGRAGGYPADYKMLWLSNTNYLNQLAEVNKTAEAFRKLDFMLVTEQFMTSTAKFADIVLPVCTFLERDDLYAPMGSDEYCVLGRAIEPLGESRSQLDICAALAPRLGINDYSDRPAEKLVRDMVGKLSAEIKLPDYGELKDFGIYKLDLSADRPEKEISPGKDRMRTPSGKIEIGSEIITRMNEPLIPVVPEYMESWEGLSDPLAEKYPLQLISPHLKRRAHSQFENLPWLRELQVQALSINTVDAEARNIREGDMLRVFNNRGEVRIPARVTERIMPGVVAIPQGAWFSPDENGVDHGGCANVLTKNMTSPGGAFASHTALVQVEKVAD